MPIDPNSDCECIECRIERELPSACTHIKWELGDGFLSMHVVTEAKTLRNFSGFLLETFKESAERYRGRVVEDTIHECQSHDDLLIFVCKMVVK